MLNLCSDGHDEICHEGNTCPLCLRDSELQEQIHNLEEQIDKL